MRIVSGKYRGMKLVGFEGRDIRPTADRVKESLFNILRESVVGADVLDLFCGSGNLGIECLSRGAEFVRFNDISKASITVLKSNLARLKDDNYAVSNSDYKSCLSLGEKYGLIFIDPPYASDAGVRALEIISERGCLDVGGIAVLERGQPFNGSVSGLTAYDERKYGGTYLTFFRADGD